MYTQDSVLSNLGFNIFDLGLHNGPMTCKLYDLEKIKTEIGDI